MTQLRHVAKEVLIGVMIVITTPVVLLLGICVGIVEMISEDGRG